MKVSTVEKFIEMTFGLLMIALASMAFAVAYRIADANEKMAAPREIRTCDVK